MSALTVSPNLWACPLPVHSQPSCQGLVLNACWFRMDFLILRQAGCCDLEELRRTPQQGRWGTWEEPGARLPLSRRGCESCLLQRVMPIQLSSWGRPESRWVQRAHLTLPRWAPRGTAPAFPRGLSKVKALDHKLQVQTEVKFGKSRMRTPIPHSRTSTDSSILLNTLPLNEKPLNEDIFSLILEKKLLWFLTNVKASNFSQIEKQQLNMENKFI